MKRGRLEESHRDGRGGTTKSHPNHTVATPTAIHIGAGMGFSLATPLSFSQRITGW